MFVFMFNLVVNMFDFHVLIGQIYLFFWAGVAIPWLGRFMFNVYDILKLNVLSREIWPLITDLNAK